MATKKSKKKKAVRDQGADQAALENAATSLQSSLGGRADREVPPTAVPEAEESETRSGGQAGNLQGLSDTANADSESVDELLEEGNSFEAGVVKGVEDAPNADEGEIKTHEVPEDDVPVEYLDDEDE